MRILLTMILFFVSLACFAQRECIVERAESQVGVREATNNNDGPEIKTYLAAVGLPERYQYCGAFIAWSYDGCGAFRPIGKAAAWTPAWFPVSRVIYTPYKTTEEPRPGDVGGIYNYGLKRIAHVFIIKEWGDGNSSVTIEGNTNAGGSRVGDGVYKRTRLKSQIAKVSKWI